MNVGCVPSKHLLAVGESAFASRDNRSTPSSTATTNRLSPWATALGGTDELVERFRQRNYVDVADHFETDDTVGVHIVGPRAADTAVEAPLAVKFGLTVDDIIDTVHPFSTFSEAFKRASQAFRRDTSTVSCCIE